MKVAHPRRKAPGTVLVDFDGVISPNSIPLTIDLLHRFIAARRPLSRQDLEDLVRVAVPFSVSQTIEYLFHGLGIEGSLQDFYAAFQKFEAGGKIRIEPEFGTFTEWCKRKGITLKLVTTASASRLSGLAIDPKDVFHSGVGSKADPRTYTRILKTLDCIPNRTLVIDDCPLALVAARTAGFRTVLMETTLYSRKYTRAYDRWIDFRVRSWAGFSRRCALFFR